MEHLVRLLLPSSIMSVFGTEPGKGLVKMKEINVALLAKVYQRLVDANKGKSRDKGGERTI